jgi:hypothetical protein
VTILTLIGIVMTATPFVALYLCYARTLGHRTTSAIFLTAAALVAWMYVAAYFTAQ